MAEGFIPYRDAEALQWMQAFSAGISASPITYQLTAIDAATIASAVQAFADALALATTPPTRTPANISLKDQTRNSAEQVCRQYAAPIKVSAGISDQDKIDIGVRPVNHDHDPIPVPPTSPLLSIIGCTPGSQTLRYSDSTTPDSRGKPFGATELLLFRKIGEEPATDWQGAEFVGKFTKNPVGVAFEPEDNKKIVTYWGRWASRKGELGPWSLPISMAIAA